MFQVVRQSDTMSDNLQTEVKFKGTTHEVSLSESLKSIEQKMANVRQRSKVLKAEVHILQRENDLLDREIKINESLNIDIENDVTATKSKTYEAATGLEIIQWKLFKLEILKDFEIEQNKVSYKHMFDYGKLLHTENPTQNWNQSEIGHFAQCSQTNSDNGELKIIKDKIQDLTKEINKRKSQIKLTDPKLHSDISMLEKRNKALLTRYQRQLQEAESRLRQMSVELNSLKNR